MRYITGICFVKISFEYFNFISTKWKSLDLEKEFLKQGNYFWCGWCDALKLVLWNPFARKPTADSGIFCFFKKYSLFLLRLTRLAYRTKQIFARVIWWIQKFRNTISVWKKKTHNPSHYSTTRDIVINKKLFLKAEISLFFHRLRNENI